MKLWNAPVIDELNVDMTLGGIDEKAKEEDSLKWAGSPIFDYMWDNSLADGTAKPS